MLLDRYVLAWLVLMLATVFSSALGVAGTAGVRAAGIGVLTIAFAKVAIIMSNFMEVRHAPLPLRLLCCGWLAIVLGLLGYLYGATGA